MATNTFNSVYHHHHHHSLRRRHSIDCPPAATNTLFLRPATTTPSTSLSHSHSTSFAATSATFSTPTTNPSTSETATSLDLLQQHLTAKNFRQADEETRRLLIALAGDASVKRGYVFFSEVQFIAADDLKAIDALWRQHSDGKFGYSVQKKIWKKENEDFTKFFIKVGWMKKLESSEVEQYNYRSFPTEFIWEMEEEPPLGHLPLTNALRGTQLLACILNHPAFDGGDEEDVREGEEERESAAVNPLSKRIGFKPNYTF